MFTLSMAFYWVVFSVVGTFLTWLFKDKRAGYSLGAVFAAFIWFSDYIWMHSWPF